MLKDLLDSKDVRETLMDELKNKFEDNKNGTVTDTRTGLTWLQDTNIFGKQLSWYDAVLEVKKLKIGGHKDWRLPTKDELSFLLSKGFRGIRAPFKNIQIQFYWTSTDYAYEPDYAYALGMTSGLLANADKNKSHHYVWPVYGRSK